MSFIVRATAWTHVSDAEVILAGNRSNRAPGALSPRLTPLNVMTGSRIAASRNLAVGWAAGQTWDEVGYAQRAEPRPTDQLRRPYQQLLEVLSRRTNRAQQPRVCPRCGQPPHTDWGHPYERLVCMEITVG